MMNAALLRLAACRGVAGYWRGFCGHRPTQKLRTPLQYARTPTTFSCGKMSWRMLSSVTALYTSGKENTIGSEVLLQTSSNAQPVVIDVDTSAPARWAADAAQTASELPSQGDFTSLGLGGYSPIGLIQWSLEYLHVDVHLPWWSAIIVSTLVLRTMIFPIGVRIQANAVKLNNIRPQQESIMAKVRQYNQAGNSTLSAQQTAKLYALYQKHGCNPMKMFIMPLVQFPLFLSFFIAIRRMAAVPVESMKTGGILWFSDLTIPDPYYVLPVMACLSFITIIELGGEAGVTNPQTEKLKTFFRAISILLIPVTATLPTGLFMYWLTTSTVSMGQILLLKIPRVRKAMGIPDLIKHPPAEAKQEGKGFLATVKENYRSAVLIDKAKKEEKQATAMYEKIKEDRSPKLYDQPPHKR